MKDLNLNIKYIDGKLVLFEGDVEFSKFPSYGVLTQEVIHNAYGEFEIVDFHSRATIFFKHGMPNDVDLFAGGTPEDDAEVRKTWGMKPLSRNNEDSYEPDCYSCGDGGCPNCRPSWFI